jgi:serine/threonine protein kinase
MIPTAQRHLPLNSALQSGKYRILNILGQGGFGITYLAEHQIFGEVALKELFLSSGTAQCSRENSTQKNVIAHFDDVQFKNFKDRFLEEARTLYKLKDVKGVVKVLDIFEENSTVYFSMEYLEGEKLEDYVKKQKKLSEKEGLDIILAIGRTLSEIHKRGVLHRDVKPANVIIGKNGEVSLIDFGIARNYVDEVTETHTTFHSPRYSPPEQKIARSKMGDYSDVYSLGATAYYIFTGEHPQSIEERITGDYVSPKVYASNLPDSMCEAISKSLNIRERERFQKVDEFLLALANKNSVPTPQYSNIPQAEVAKIIVHPVADDATKIEPFAPKQANIPVQNDKTILEKPPVFEAKNIVEDDKTMLEKSPTFQEKNIIKDDKTILEPIQTAPIDEDKTFILDRTDRPKATFSLKTWLKTKDGRIIGGAIILTTLGVIISAIVSTCNSRVPIKSNVTISKLTDTAVVMAQNLPDTLRKDTTVNVLIPPPVLTKKTTKKTGTQTQSKNYQPVSPQTTTSLPIHPQEPKTMVPKDFCQDFSKPASGLWRLSGSTIVLCDELSCNINGKSGTYRMRDATTKLILDCLMQDGKSYELVYDKNNKTLEYDGKQFRK